MQVELRAFKRVERIIKNAKNTSPFIIFDEGEYLFIKFKADGLIVKYKMMKESESNDVDSIYIGVIQEDMIDFLNKLPNRKAKLDIRFENNKMIGTIKNIDKSSMQEESVNINKMKRNTPTIKIIQSAHIDSKLKTLHTANRLCMTYDYYPFTEHLDFVCNGKVLNIVLAEMKAVAKISLDITMKDTSFDKMITKQDFSKVYSLIKDFYTKSYECRLDFCETGIIFSCMLAEVYVPYSDEPVNFPYDTVLNIFNQTAHSIQLEDRKINELRKLYKNASKEYMDWEYKGLSVHKKANNKMNFIVLLNKEKAALLPLAIFKSYPNKIIGYNFRYFDFITANSVLSMTTNNCLVIRENELQLAICPIN
ncbi:hypothetical protein MKC71_07450 [[Clostridium] innocuum]|nr:hypothetical protein [[Clostridium] innocuum]